MTAQDAKLTLTKLAELAGVSASTASRALNNNPLIKKQTREHVQALAKQHNFSVNKAASRLRTQKNHVIAVILNLIEDTEQSITDPFLLKIVGELNKALNEKGYELLLSNSFMASGDWANYFINSQRADGMIIIGQGKNSDNIDAAAKAGVPLVVWGEPTMPATYPIVGGDNYSGGYKSTAHLIEQGCKRIMFLGDPEHAEMKQRYHGYLDAQRAYDIAPINQLTASIDITSTAAYNYINQFIRDNGLIFDGIVCVSDMVALGALKALKERYVGIPSDVCLVGYDDIALAELMHPSLSTVRQNTQQAAVMMVEQLINQLEGKAASAQVVDTDLIVRRSSAK